MLNDVNDDRVNPYRVVQNYSEAFIREFTWILSSRKIFKCLNDTTTETLTNVQRAARFRSSATESRGTRS